jgi:hypothetical protein
MQLGEHLVSQLAERSSFVSNIDGGAVVVNGSNATFLICNFEGNRADFGGTIYGNLPSNVNITNTTIYDNSAKRCGGAIFFGSLFTVTTLLLEEACYRYTQAVFQTMKPKCVEVACCISC